VGTPGVCGVQSETRMCSMADLWAQVNGVARVLLFITQNSISTCNCGSGLLWLCMESGFSDNTAVSIGAGRTIDGGLLVFLFVRSSGPGGQNVNKRATKAQLRVSVEDLGLPGAMADRLRKIAGGAITQEDVLLISCDETRSQGRNRQGCIDQLRAMVNAAAVVPKNRKKTKPTRGSVERRIGEKKRRGQIKKRRGSSDED